MLVKTNTSTFAESIITSFANTQTENYWLR
jgi:hypothetical protein